MKFQIYSAIDIPVGVVDVFDLVSHLCQDEKTNQSRTNMKQRSLQLGCQRHGRDDENDEYGVGSTNLRI
jgi:hypothetical protein